MACHGDVELQKVARRVARSPRGLRRNPCEASLREIEAVNEGVDEANGVVGADVIVNSLRQEQELRALESCRILLRRRWKRSPAAEFFTCFRTLCKNYAQN
jgi:hypothetical protein